VLGVLTRAFRTREDVAIEAPSREFDLTFPRVRSFLLWTRVRAVRWRILVAGLPLRELLIQHAKIQRLANAIPRFSIAEACVVITGSLDALDIAPADAHDIWEWWHEANCLSMPRPGLAPSSGTSSVLDLVFQLERWPFNFAPERVMEMTAAEAVARIREFEAASAAAREAAVA
jgi:hypothetical protein